MTNPDIAALRVALAKATPGPWRIEGKSAIDGSDAVKIGAPDFSIGRFYAYHGSTANAELIVAVINALPSLLREDRQCAGVREDRLHEYAATFGIGEKVQPLEFILNAISFAKHHGDAPPDDLDLLCLAMEHNPKAAKIVTDRARDRLYRRWLEGEFTPEGDMLIEFQARLDQRATTPQGLTAPGSNADLIEQTRDFIEYHFNQAATYLMLGVNLTEEKWSSLNYHIQKAREGVRSITALTSTPEAKQSEEAA